MHQQRTLQYQDRFMPIHNEHSHASGFAWMGMVLIISLSVIYVVYKLGVRITTKQDINPLETLKNRFAQGEITKEQYTEIKKELTAK